MQPTFEWSLVEEVESNNSPGVSRKWLKGLLFKKKKNNKIEKGENLIDKSLAFYLEGVSSRNATTKSDFNIEKRSTWHKW